ALEAAHLASLLPHPGRVAGHQGPGGDVPSHHAAGPDQCTGADPDTGKNGCIAADADVVLDGRAQDALPEPGAGWMRIVGEDNPWADEDSPADSDVLE